jgi:hypothetical protein
LPTLLHTPPHNLQGLCSVFKHGHKMTANTSNTTRTEGLWYHPRTWRFPTFLQSVSLYIFAKGPSHVAVVALVALLLPLLAVALLGVLLSMVLIGQKPLLYTTTSSRSCASSRFHTLQKERRLLQRPCASIKMYGMYQTPLQKILSHVYLVEFSACCQNNTWHSVVLPRTRTPCLPSGSYETKSERKERRK